MQEELIEVNYYYIKKAQVRVEYIDKLTGEKLTEDEIIKGHIGDEYKQKKNNSTDMTQQKNHQMTKEK